MEPRKDGGYDKLVALVRSLSRELEPMPTGREPALTPLPGIRAVLFDVYGTMLISGSGDVGTLLPGGAPEAAAAALGAGGVDERLGTAVAIPGLIERHIEAAHRAAHEVGVEYPEVDIREIWRAVLGDLKSVRVLPHTADEDAISRIAVAYECAVNPVWPMPGVEGVLGQLRSRDLALGIVSNAQFYTPVIFEALTGTDHVGAGFLPDLCAWSYTLRQAKPSPVLFDPVVHALQRRGIEPGEAVYVGNDMLNDITTARKAGMITVLFAGDQRSLRLREDDPRCAGVEPDAVITDLGQLIDLLT